MKLIFNPDRMDIDRSRTAHEAVDRVAEAVVKNKTRVIDLDLRAYFDNVRHDILLRKVAERVNDDKVMRLLKLILKGQWQARCSAGWCDITTAQQYLSQ